MADYEFRPHHLMCNFCFIGKGYNDNFTANLSAINSNLKLNPHKTIKLIKTSDDICSKCQHNLGSNCTSETKVQKIDQLHMEVLGLNHLDEITWSNAVELIKSKVTKDKFSKMCSSCEWYNLGICYNKLFIDEKD